MKYLFKQVRMAIIKKKNLQTINAGEGVESRESYIADGNVNFKKNVHHTLLEDSW